MATEGKPTFSLGISSEQKLSLPLDELIKNARKEKLAANKKGNGGPGSKHKQQNVKKTVSVMVSKAERASAARAAASIKRQSVVNKRRPGLILPQRKKGKPMTVQLRRRQTSALKAAQAIKANAQRPRKQIRSGGLDVSNIVQHFKTHPTKFDLPKGTNLRITINLNNVKPVVGAKK